jgi:hypothetical protein
MTSMKKERPEDRCVLSWAAPHEIVMGQSPHSPTEYIIAIKVVADK